jgi:hypothetical protein
MPLQKILSEPLQLASAYLCSKNGWHSLGRAVCHD